MRHFGQEFGGNFDGGAGVHRTVDLGRTFRSVDKIAIAAKTFVLRNPAQISKQIVAAGTATEPAIRRGTGNARVRGVRWATIGCAWQGWSRLAPL
jgi:hypothetical protein